MNVFTFVDSSTIVMRGSSSPTKDLVKAATTVGSPLRKSPEFMADYQKIATDATMWMVVTTKGKWMDALGQVADRPLGIDMGVRVTDAVKVDSRIRIPKPDAAQKMATALKEQLAGVAMFVAGDVKVEANDIVVTASIKSEMIDLVLAGMGGGVSGTDDPPPVDPPNPCGD